MKNIKVLSKDGITLKTENTYCDTDISIEVDNTNLIAENIKKDTTILGVTGNYIGESEVDERFKQLVEGTITEVSDDSITTIRDYAFYGNTTLTTIDLPNITSLGNYVFYNCSALTSVDLPNVTTIRDYVFYGCKNVTSVNLPNATTIGPNVFYKCSSLTSVNLPNVTSLSYGTFYNCSSLTTVILSLTTNVCTLSNTDAFKNTPIANSTTEGFIYVPDELVEDYKVATNWSTYASKIKPISELPAEE